jgi:hypothetical protein
MSIGGCMQRAINMTVQHWGPPSLTDGVPTSNRSSSANATNPSVSLSTTRAGGIEFANVTFPGRCGGMSTTMPFETTNATTAIVINVTAITNANADSAVAIRMESCDGAVSFNATKPGVFVIKGSSVAVFFERWYGSAQNKGKSCPGDSFLSFTSATLENYCKLDTSLADCKNVAPEAKSSATSGQRRRMVATAFATVATLVAALA